MPTLYLIDGSAYIYRAFFALPPLSNSKGLQTKAVYGFTTMLLKVLRDHHFPRCGAAAGQGADAIPQGIEFSRA